MASESGSDGNVGSPITGLFDSQTMAVIEVTSNRESFFSALSATGSSFNWNQVFSGIAIVGGAILAVSMAPAAIGILTAGGVAALVAELAGVGIVAVGASGGG